MNDRLCQMVQNSDNNLFNINFFGFVMLEKKFISIEVTKSFTEMLHNNRLLNKYIDDLSLS